MTLQNRVTPFGDIVAIPQRGMFTGNRGIIHDPVTRTLLKRRWTNRAWLICACEYQGLRRVVMGDRSWTELFFFDEAIALASGHRPCFLCRRPAARAFRAAWVRAKGGDAPSASQIDAVLHAERLADGRMRAHAMDRRLRDLPDGAVIAEGTTAYAIVAGQAFAWTKDGYGPPRPLLRARVMLTPPSTLAALERGYRPVLHPTLAH